MDTAPLGIAGREAPAVAMPAAAVPVVTVPVVTVPAVTVAAVTQPAVTKPAATMSATTVSAVTEPAGTTPVVTVPAVTAVFWVVTVLTTGMGEAAADFLGGISVPLAVPAGGLGLVAALSWQFRAGEYVATRYWSAVAAVTVVGTMVADGPHKLLGIPYVVSTVLCAAAVALCLVVWWRNEGTLSVHSISTRRRQAFYWATVLATVALGTALGDLTAMVWHLDSGGSALLFAVLIAVPALGWAGFGLHPVVAIWSAYVLTRPSGASVADWLAKPHVVAGGHGLGDGPVALGAAIVVVALVGWCAVTRRDVQPAPPPAVVVPAGHGTGPSTVGS